RMERAMAERQARDPEGNDGRALIAELEMMIQPVRTGLDAERRELRVWWSELMGGPGTGRPRERWHVGDYPNRIGANDLRRRAIAEGLDLAALHSIIVRTTDEPNDPGERIALAMVADPRYRWRLWLVCPRC